MQQVVISSAGMTKKQGMHLIGAMIGWVLFPFAVVSTWLLYLLAQIELNLCQSLVGSLSQLLSSQDNVCTGAQNTTYLFILGICVSFIILSLAVSASVNFVEQCQ